MNRHKKSVVLLTIAGSVCFFTLYPVQSQPSPRPKFMRLSLAGHSIDFAQRVYDARAKYYLIGTGDCDGAHMSLLLTPDPHAEGWGFDEEYMRKLPRVTLPRLRTGWGVNIGETPSQVKRKLGKEPDSYTSDRQKGELIYEYRSSYSQRDSTGRQNSILYKGSYKFRNGRLWSIQYSLNKADG